MSYFQGQKFLDLKKHSIVCFPTATSPGVLDYATPRGVHCATPSPILCICFKLDMVGAMEQWDSSLKTDIPPKACSIEESATYIVTT